MSNENLKQKLAKLDRQELENLAEKLVNDKIEIQKDLVTVGNTLTSIMQTLGVMNEDYSIVTDKGAIIGSITSFATGAMMRPKQLEHKFSFIMEAAPLLEKYKHLLKQK